MTIWDPFERARRARRQATAVAVVSVLALVVVVAGARWAFAALTGPDTDTAAGEPASGAPARRSDDGRPDLVWQQYRPGVDLPVSTSSGPAVEQDGRARGFAHTELGAALAAIHLTTRTDRAVGPAVFGPTIQEQVVGPDAPRFAQTVADDYEKERQRRALPAGTPFNPERELSGYRVEQYSPEVARVVVYQAGQEGSAPLIFAFRFELRWVGDDWKLVAPAGGTLATALTRSSSIPPGSTVLTKGA